MNPFRKSNSISEISVCCTNIRSLGISKKQLTHKKLNSIMDLKNNINILIDSKVTDTEANDICNRDFKYLLKDFKHIGTLTKVKGILILYNKHATKIKNLKVIRDGQLLEFSFLVSNEWVNVVACYAPPEMDDPEFLLEAKSCLNNMPGDYGLICGDLNTTLDPKWDRFGYTQDSHRRSRAVINNWINTEELIDAVRFFHPIGPLYSWTTLNGDKKGRLDHLLVTPKLMEHITRVNYIYLGKKISDHSSLNFAIDIEKQEKGKGIFRANPSLLKHPNYITLMHNVIYNDILEAVKDKTSPIYITSKDTFLEQITVQEELVKVEMLQGDTNWPLTERINHLNELLADIKSKITPLKVILKEPLEREPAAVLENSLVSMRTHTTTYQGTLNKLRRDKKKEINDKIQEINSILDDGDNQDEIDALEEELNSLTDEMLQEQGSFSKTMSSSTTAK